METTQQPTAIPGMVIGGNRNAHNLPIGPDGRQWSNGFFDCLGDFGTCIIATLAPCIIYGQNRQRLEHLNTKGLPYPQPGQPVNNYCLFHGALTCCGVGWVLQIMNRGNVRARYNISGDPVKDCLSAWCCSPCELTQEAREIQLEEQNFMPESQ